MKPTTKDEIIKEMDESPLGYLIGALLGVNAFVFIKGIIEVLILLW
jgi:hypothetical protein